MYMVSFPVLVVCVFFLPLFSLAGGSLFSWFFYFCFFCCHSHLLFYYSLPSACSVYFALFLVFKVGVEITSLRHFFLF